MSLKSFPYKWTCLVGLIFLGSLLWSDIFLDGPGFLLIAFSILSLFVSLIVSIVLAVFQRTRAALYRIFINATICLLFFPTTRLGDSLRERMFLRHLSRFQAVTNLLIENAAPTFNLGISFTVTQLPPGYSDLHVADKVLVDSKQKNITVRYISRDSSALGHRGYMYRSDDDPAALMREFPRLGYTRIAPHWFFFSD
jgi:hypothetical protein